MREIATSQEIKACCAAVYGSDWARFLIGDSMHPGGEKLTERLAYVLELTPGARVLDLAAGRGASAIWLAQRFGCEVVGIDLSQEATAASRETASRAGVAALVSFEVADAEDLPFADGEFDALICECAFCTFPNKPRAAEEMARVLRPGGRAGIGDLVRRGDLPQELMTLAGWVGCIADAQPESEYLRYLEDAGFVSTTLEVHDDALAKLVEDIRRRLFGVTLSSKLANLDLADIDLGQAAVLGRAAQAAVRNGKLGYVLISAIKPQPPSMRLHSRACVENGGYAA